MDRIILRNVQFYAYHGANPEERAQGQPFAVDITAHLDLSVAGASDRIADTVNYSHLFRIAKEIVEGPPRNLLESLAEAVAAGILATHAQIQSVDVRMVKVRPPIREAKVGDAAVEIHRERVAVRKRAPRRRASRSV